MTGSLCVPAAGGSVAILRCNFTVIVGDGYLYFGKDKRGDFKILSIQSLLTYHDLFESRLLDVILV